jgi:hypothetical protein
MGGLLWENNSFPFNSYASTSRILATSAVSSWLTAHNLTALDLRPLLSEYPSKGNPYDFSQGSVTAANGTGYLVYEYILPQSAYGTTIGVWVENATSATPTPTVAKIFSYPQSGPNTISGITEDQEVGAGQEVQDTHLSGSDEMTGATYESKIFSDLESPPTCGTYCWLLDNWLGAGNFDWYKINPPSNAYFIQGEVVYWGGSRGEPSNCGGTISSNCIIFQYAYGSTTLHTYAPDVGDWASSNSVNSNWVYGSANCNNGTNNVQEVTLTVEDTTTSASTHLYLCMPVITNSQFVEERPVISGTTYADEPEYSGTTHSFTAYLLNDVGSDVDFGIANTGWNLVMQNAEGTNLVSSSGDSNHGTYTTWTDTWDSSAYP